MARSVFGNYKEVLAKYDLEQRTKWLNEARASGELTEYTDEELVTEDLVFEAKK